MTAAAAAIQAVPGIIRGPGRPEDGRYLHDEKRVPSVTEVLRCWGEPDGLCSWTADLAIRRAVELGVTERDLPGERHRGTPRYWDARRAGEAARDTAGDHGTRVHDRVEARWHGVEPEPIFSKDDATEVDSAVRRIRAWMDEHPRKLVPTHTEWRMTNPHLGGTCDWIFQERDGAVSRRVIGDLKTSKSVSETWFMQLAAYAWLHGDVDGVFVLHVPRVIPGEKERAARAYWREGRVLKGDIRSFKSLLRVYYRADTMRRQLGKSPRVKAR